jgi:hypothetical protein
MDIAMMKKGNSSKTQSTGKLWPTTGMAAETKKN